MLGQSPQQLLLVPLLVGTDGERKMSKSLGNYITIEDEPNEMYGKTMSIPDKLVLDYCELLTDISDEELSEFRQGLATDSVNPMELKKRLAFELVLQFHGAEAACEADIYFSKVVQKGELPKEIPQCSLPPTAFEGQIPIEVIIDVALNAKLVKSRGEGKRLLAQRAVEIDGKGITSSMVTIRDGSIIKVGKHRFVRLVNADKRGSG
jgi:tyrosyl-tRNA synthetase